MSETKKYPRVAVKIIFVWDDRIMMFHHPNGTWDFPGGTMEWGEDVMETLRRELREELDYELRGEPEMLGIYNDFSAAAERHKVQLQYLKRFRRRPKFLSLEGVEYAWLDCRAAREVLDPKFVFRILNH